jgi:ATP-dependent Lon protease
MDSQNTDTTQKVYPLLPLRDVVVYPHMAVPLFVGREKSILALEKGMSTDKQVILVTQKDPAEDNPALDDVHQIGTLATILQLLKLPDGTLKVLVEGSSRVKLINSIEGENFLETQFETLVADDQDEKEVGALSRATKILFDQYVNLSKKYPRMWSLRLMLSKTQTALQIL